MLNNANVNFKMMNVEKIEDLFKFYKIYSKSEIEKNPLLYEERRITVDGIEDKIIVPTIYYRYIIAKFCKEFFKNTINYFDIGKNEYFKESFKEGINDNEYQRKLLKYTEENLDDINKIYQELEDWKNNHLDYYRSQPSLPDSSIIINNFIPNGDLSKFDYAKFVSENNISVEDAINMYKSCNEFLKFINESNPNPLDKYCVVNKLMLNYEHRNEYNEFKSNLYKRYNILSPEELKASLPIRKIRKTRLSLNRQKADLEVYNNFFYK